jgi:hypothetical protein
MKEQTFARRLWLSLLPRFVGLTWITGFDIWLLRQVHRSVRVAVSSTSTEWGAPAAGACHPDGGPKVTMAERVAPHDGPKSMSAG